MYSIEDPTEETATEEMRGMVHSMWASVAPRWEEHADYAAARGAHIIQRMLDVLAVTPGEDVLELACGPANAGLAAAELVGSGGHVVVSDVVPEMVAIAERRAAARGLGNVQASVLDLEDIDRPDATFDAVLCCEGLMFAVRPHRALHEVARILRPGGRAAFAVWGPRAANPWLALVFDAVSAETGFPVPPPGVPGPFSLADPDRLTELLRDAGFVAVTIERIATPARAGSFDEWWARTQALAGPLATILGQLPATTQTAIAERLREDVAPYATATGLELPGLTLLASAHRP